MPAAPLVLLAVIATGCGRGLDVSPQAPLSVADVDGLRVEIAISEDRGVCSRVADEDWVCQPNDSDEAGDSGIRWAQLEREPGAPLLLRAIVLTDTRLQDLGSYTRMAVGPNRELILARVGAAPLCFRSAVLGNDDPSRVIVSATAIDTGSGVTMSAEPESGTGTGCG